MGLANSLALKLAGIIRDTKDPSGGTIMRTADGEPTGLLIDAARELILPVVPQPSVEERRVALSKASNYSLTKGVTTVLDFGRYFHGKILQDLRKRTGRVVSQWLYLGGVKAYIDGSLGSNSALFYEVAIHAIGDRANDLILDMHESVASTNGIRDRRFRIEHAQHFAPGSAVRLDKLGKERAEKGSYLFHTLKSTHALVAFGSDWPVVDIDPMNTIRAAVKRIPPGWEISWIPSERMSFIDALDAHTISAARACFLDENIGSLSTGKLADFVILSTNSWDNLKVEAFASVEATYLGGVQAYSSNDVVM